MKMKDFLVKQLIAQDRKSGIFLLESNSHSYLDEIVQEVKDKVFHFSSKQEKSNFAIFKPGEKSFSIDTVNNFLEFEAKRPVSTDHKLIVVEDVHLLGQFADKILKTVEEPNPFNLILLLTNNKYACLPTIISRSFCLTELIDEKSYFSTAKDKYLSFLNNPNFPDDEMVQNLLTLGLKNVIAAMFENLQSEEHLRIARTALAMHKASLKQENIALYILYEFYMLGALK